MTQDGTSSALGFYYQGCYALVAILRARDEGAGVAVETYDDVVLDTSSLKTLSQLKHKAAPLSIKSDDFWKAVGNWIGHLNDVGLRFRFVLTSRLPADSVLRQLADHSSHAALCAALHEEAARVTAAADETQAEAYRRRVAGCRAFLSLSEMQRLDFIRRLDVEDDSFNVTEYGPKVAEQLTQTIHGIRTKVAERLIEWWDRQVAVALTGKRSRVLRREEVIETITRITQLFFDDRLPDDFADKDPPQALDDTPVLVRQIKLIEGTPFWITQAKQERWRARGQRDSWLSEQFIVVERLDNFDKGLIAEWRLRFELIEMPKSESETAEKNRGQQLFRWAFHDAWREVPPIHPEWKTPYLVRGTYQELANARIVGWHPRYVALLEEEPGDDG